MNKNHGKTITMGVRMTPEFREAVQKVATLTGRSSGAFLEYAAHLYILQNYPEAMKKGSKVTLSLVEAPPVEKKPRAPRRAKDGR